MTHEVAIGSSFTIVCTAEGFPIPSMQWYLNDTMINNSSNRYIVDDIVDDTSMNSITSTLTVMMVEFNDSGAYYCKAASSQYDLAPVNSERANITVNGEYSIHKKNSHICLFV